MVALPTTTHGLVEKKPCPTVSSTLIGMPIDKERLVINWECEAVKVFRWLMISLPNGILSSEVEGATGKLG